MLVNLEVIAEHSEHLPRKLAPVIGDERAWHSEPANDVLPHEVFHCLFSNRGYRLCLNPFGEVFGGHYEEFQLFGGRRKRGSIC